jgi:prephenate dehydrogenase
MRMTPSPASADGHPRGPGLGSVAIVGAGQVGTMIGMALRGTGGDRGASEVTLFDRSGTAAAASLERGAGDRLLTTAAEALAADTIVLALPVPDILDYLAEYGGRARAGSLFLDTGSAKGAVVRAMRDCLAPAVHAVGGHPMVGTEGVGPAAARPALLRDSVFVLTPVHDDAEALTRARAFVHRLGARPLEMAAEMHDATVARTSHLPHVTAFAVAAAAGRAAAGRSFAPGLASTGYRSATRLADSDPYMVAGFLSANRAEVHSGVQELRSWLARFEAELETTPERLGRFLAEARAHGAKVA